MEEPQLRRRHAAAGPPPSEPAATSNVPDTPPSNAAEDNSCDALRNRTTQRSTAWSVLDIVAVALLSVLMLAVAAAASQLITHYRTMSRSETAASADSPAALWMVLKARLSFLRKPAAADVARIAVDRALSQLAADPSYTRYGATRIFFRPLPRKVYLTSGDVAAVANMSPPAINPIAHDAKGDAYVMTWGMADINPFTNTLNASLASTLSCAWDGQTFMQVMRTQRSLETGVRVYSSYTHANEKEAEKLTALISRGACLARVMELMCAGDKWEIICPPEASGSNATRDAYEHRIDVQHVGGAVAAVERVEAELDYVVRQLPLLERFPEELDEVSRQVLEIELEATAPMTRAALLKKVIDHWRPPQ